MRTVTPIDTPGLGDRTYLAHDGKAAVVVDPQRDYDRVLAVGQDAGAQITHVFETHIHNDHVTGGPALAQEVGAAYHVNADDEVSFERVGVRDGDVIEVGAMKVRVVHTPGHTHTHLSYALSDGDKPRAVFTGGSLLYGSTGRPDLLGPDHTDTLVRAQWRSAHRLAEELPDETEVFPTHGFGSFCSATQTPDQVAGAQRDMARIGLGKPAAMATGKPDEWADGAPLGSFPRATFQDLKRAMDAGEDLLVLDARSYDVVSVDDSFGENASPAGLPIVA